MPPLLIRLQDHESVRPTSSQTGSKKINMSRAPVVGDIKTTITPSNLLKKAINISETNEELNQIKSHPNKFYTTDYQPDNHGVSHSYIHTFNPLPHTDQGSYRQVCVKFNDFPKSSKRLSYCFQGLKTYEKY